MRLISTILLTILALNIVGQQLSCDFTVMITAGQSNNAGSGTPTYLDSIPDKYKLNDDVMVIPAGEEWQGIDVVGRNHNYPNADANCPYWVMVAKDYADVTGKPVYVLDYSYGGRSICKDDLLYSFNIGYNSNSLTYLWWLHIKRGLNKLDSLGLDNGKKIQFFTWFQGEKDARECANPGKDPDFCANLYGTNWRNIYSYITDSIASLGWSTAGMQEFIMEINDPVSYPISILPYRKEVIDTLKSIANESDLRFYIPTQHYEWRPDSIHLTPWSHLYLGIHLQKQIKKTNCSMKTSGGAILR